MLITSNMCAMSMTISLRIIGIKYIVAILGTSSEIIVLNVDTTA